MPRRAASSALSAVDGHALVVETEALQDDLRALLVWTNGEGLRLDGLNATQASPEEVFLDLASARMGVA